MGRRPPFLHLVINDLDSGPKVISLRTTFGDKVSLSRTRAALSTAI